MAPPAEPALLKEAAQHEAEGNPDKAIALLRDGIAPHRNFFRSRLELSRLLYGRGDMKAAAQAVQSAEQNDPLAAEFSAIQRAMQSGDLQSAQSLAEGMLSKIPGHPRAIFTLASLAQQKDDHEARADHLQRGLAVAPANLPLRHMLVGALEDCGSYRAALDEARTILRMDPGFAGQMTLATLLFRLGQNAGAKAACEAALRAAGPNKAQVYEAEVLYAQVLRVVGERTASVQSFKRCLALNPASGPAWWGLADLKNHIFEGKELSTLKTISTHPRVDLANKSMATFALAKALETQGLHDDSMAAYKAANRLHPDQSFRPDAFRRAIQSIAASFTPQALETRAPRQPGGSAPIFIVGLPRSGSTLVEQILASHSAIEGTVESPILPSVKRLVHRHCAKQMGGSYLDHIGSVGTDDLAAFGQTYLDESTLLHSGTTPFFTDKLPFNFEHVGLISKILPQAVIIDARRNPLDCGLSNFRQHFSRGSAFASDLAHIGTYYRGYLALMDHWDEVLPGRVFHVQYEDLIQDAETTVRGLLDHVGLPFEEACLRFYENKRSVRTASSEQVRQPLYTSSIGIWRQVEGHLEPLKSALGEDVLARFAEHLR